MTNVPLGRGAYKRDYGRNPEVRMLNRLFEENPANRVEGTSLLARPGTSFLAGFGNGPIRALATEPGAFGGDLFIISGTALFRYDGTTATAISGAVAAPGNPSMTVVVGAEYEHLFIADGTTLQYYEGVSKARGTLTTTGGIADLDEIKIDTVYYRWTAGSVDAGSPAGTLADPYLVALGTTDTTALSNMRKAINATGAAGTDYSSSITNPHTTVEGDHSDATTLDVRARTSRAGGNSIATTVETGASLSWGGATLSGGGSHILSGVPTPKSVGIVSVATTASYVMAAVSQSQRFYWINPGKTVIDALNFATAETLPDQIISLLAVGDQVWMLGQSSMEIWYATGNITAPFLRVQGRTFNRGAIEGTAVVVKDQVIVVGSDGIVYAAGSGLQRISNNGIEERIRVALKAEQG